MKSQSVKYFIAWVCILLASSIALSTAEVTTPAKKQIFLILSGDFKSDHLYIEINGKDFFMGKVFSERYNTPIFSISLGGFVIPNKQFTVKVKIRTDSGAFEQSEDITLKRGGAVDIIFMKEEKSIIIGGLEPGYSFPD